jgi:hypothetical protein
MQTKKLKLSLLPKKFGICHFEAKTKIPDWALKGEFFSITKTDKELSIVFPQEKISGGVLYEPNWRALRVEGVIEGIYAVGIIEVLAKPLAENKIPIFNISTYQTNYLFVQEKDLERAIKILSDFCQIEKIK